MTELAEGVAIGMLQEQTDAKCPFAETADGVDDIESENINKDDAAGVRGQQHNDGGVLGSNLIDGLPGKAGTVGGPCPPPKGSKWPRIDTKRSRLLLKVPGTTDIPDGTYGFTVAAHHLIPGEAALAPSELIHFMTKDDTVEITVMTPTGPVDKTKTIEKYIGYNVNGSHNGVWLPGNYYIRMVTSPIKNHSWSDLGDNPWCLHYVAAATKAAGGQFHDAHTQYSAAVEELLNKIALVLMRHECDDCAKPKINPPFSVKTRLYGLSANFKGKLTSPPSTWKLPWCASDRWGGSAFGGGRPSQAFIRAYLTAGREQR